MEYTLEDTLQKAKDRGYSVVAKSGDKTWYSLYNENFGLNLQIYPSKNNFNLTYIHGIITTSTGECGSFMNDVHFLRIQRQMYEAVLKLN